jgi:uncharacterized repeat protein (TIGR03803 family)
MKSFKLRFDLRSILSALALTLMLAPGAWSAPKYKVLYAFVDKSRGWGPYAGVVFDGQGNLYGTTSVGGTYDWGAVYELKPNPHGKWTETVLYSFCPGGWPCSDGANPDGSVILDHAGNLYGTTVYGGTGVPNGGTIFKLSLGTSDWTHTILHDFCSLPDCRDGGAPHAGMVMDEAGNLYGTAFYAFELSPVSDGWTETVLGGGGYAGLIRDAVGNLYGTTIHGGDTKCLPYGCGTAYGLSRGSGGKWKERVLHSFGSFTGDGIFPGVGALAFGVSGSLYGTTEIGGATGNGTVFKLTRSANGHWKDTILYSFKHGPSGSGPSGGVIVDKAGNVYGTTMYGGDARCDCGVVYKLSPCVHGRWKYTVLHAFIGSDGAAPEANLILDSKGNLYGTTPIGAAPGVGVVFEITP